MSKLLQLRGGTTSEHSSFTGALREVTVDTTKDTLVVHDGSTAGGFALPRTAAEVSALISNDAIDSQHYAAGSIDAEHLANDSVTTDKVHLISTSSTPSLEARSDGTTDGYIQLNCTVNSHGIKLMSPPHSAGASYTLVFPPNDGDNGQFLTSNGSGVMTWTTADLTNLSGASLTSGIIPTARINAGSIANDLIDSQHYAAGSIDLEHLSSESVDEDNLYVSNAGSNGQYLQKQSGNSGGLTWGTVDLTTLSGANLTSGIIPTARINASSIANDLITTQHIADSVALGGSLTTTTQSAADNSTKIATTAYADAAIAALADSAPSTLNTLNELAAALGDDANYAATTTTAIGLKAPIASPTFTGNIGMPNGSIDRAMIGTDQVDGSKIEDDSINSEHIADGAIDLAHMSANSVDSDQYVDGSVDDAHISGMAASKLTGALPAISGANLTGVDPFPSGTVMVFYQTAAPTGWTKSTSHNDKALRVVSGNGGGNGGTHDLTSPPSLAHVHSAAAHTHTSAAHSHGNNLSAAAHTLSIAQMPSHTHTMYGWNNGANQHTRLGNGDTAHYGPFTIAGGNAMAAVGGGGSHSHGMSGSVSSATPGATGSTTPSNSGSTTPTSFAPKYIDVIICAKDQEGQTW